MTTIPIHPMIVHFPITLTVVACIFDISSYFIKKEWLHSTTIALTYFAVFGAIAALISGFLFTHSIEGYIATLKDSHVILAVITSALIIGCSTLTFFIPNSIKKTKLSYLFTLFLASSTTFIILTALKGSTIVYSAWHF